MKSLISALSVAAFLLITPTCLFASEQRPVSEMDEETLLRTARGEGPDAVRSMARLGLLYETEQRFDDAIPWLRKAANEHEILRPWLLVHLSDSLDSAGRPADAAEVARSIVTEFPDSSASDTARIKLPALLARAGDHRQARKASKDLLRVRLDALTEADIVDAADDLAEASLESEATQIRRRVLLDRTWGRYTEKLYDHLVEMRGEDSPIYDLDFAESVELADRLQSANRHPEAQDWIERTRKRFPKKASDPRLTWTLGQSLFSSRQYESLQELEIPEGGYRHVGLTRLQGHGLWRIDRNEEFLEKMKHIVDRHSGTSELSRAQVLLGKYYLINGDDEDQAAEWLSRAIASGSDGNSGENLWTLSWIHIKAGRYQKALDAMANYLRRYPDDSYTSNSLFWSGKIHQKLGDEAKAKRFWTRLVEELPYTYYSYRAREILDLPGPTLEIDSGNRWPDQTLSSALDNDPELRVVEELDLLGLHEAAIERYRQIVGKKSDEKILAFGLADRYAKAGEPLRAIGVLNSSFRDFVRHGGTGIPDRFWEILYPINYRESIFEAAAKQRVDPWLMIAIIRQESGWDPSIVSRAGAAGLMQIMPAEAEHLGQMAGFEQVVTRDMLFDPELNIQIGAAEIRSKLDLMDEDEMLAIASYNGGQDAVNVWLARTPIEDRDLFIDSIPYNETRRYVMIVTRNREIYKLIYGDE